MGRQILTQAIPLIVVSLALRLGWYSTFVEAYSLISPEPARSPSAVARPGSPVENHSIPSAFQDFSLSVAGSTRQLSPLAQDTLGHHRKRGNGKSARYESILDIQLIICNAQNGRLQLRPAISARECPRTIYALMVLMLTHVLAGLRQCCQR